MKYIHKAFAILKLMRPQSVCLMLLFVYIPIAVETLDYYYAIQQVLPLFFLLTGEIALNDYLDREKDKINKPHRPIASGAVTIQTARMLIAILLVSSVLYGGIIYNKVCVRWILFDGIFLILTIYNLGINKIAPYKCFITALTTVICLCFVFTYFEVKEIRIYYAIVAFFYISSRELLMDIRDYEGDMKYGCQTLVVKYGKEKIYRMAVLLAIISQIIYVGTILMWASMLSKILWFIAMIILVIALSRFCKISSHKQNQIIILLWIPILLTIINIW